jgi:hypothetical protein
VSRPLVGQKIPILGDDVALLADDQIDEPVEFRPAWFFAAIAVCEEIGVGALHGAFTASGEPTKETASAIRRDVVFESLSGTLR